MVIMQGGSGEVIDEVSRKGFIKTAVKYSKKARKKGVIPALFMTHAYTENDDRFETNLIEKIKMTYFEAGRQSKALVIHNKGAFYITTGAEMIPRMGICHAQKQVRNCHVQAGAAVILMMPSPCTWTQIIVTGHADIYP